MEIGILSFISTHIFVSGWNCVYDFSPTLHRPKRLKFSSILNHFQQFTSKLKRVLGVLFQCFYECPSNFYILLYTY